jgi:adenylate cyclase
VIELWSRFLTFAIVLLAAVGLFWTGVFSGWQVKILDNLFLGRNINSQIAIIAIDDKSINKIGRWPWDREIHARLLDKLADIQPLAVGYDVSFPEKSNLESDKLLAFSLKKLNTILPEEQVDGRLQKPYSLFDTKTGLVNVHIDPDGIVRRIPSIGFASQILNKRVALPSDDFRINYVGSPGSFPTYSFVDVLENRTPIENFQNKYVLVGATAVDLHDSQITPVSAGREMAGVEIHANAMATILDNKYLVSEPKLLTLLTIFVFALLAILTANYPVGWIWLGGYFVYAFVSFDRGVIRNLIYPPAIIIIINIINIIIRYLSERAQKQYIKKAFSYYLSESVLKEILKDPNKLKLGGSRQEITVLFSDIAGFTSISEKMPPEELAKMLNDYLTRMTKIVFTNRGVLDKYIGDAVMAFWNAPIADSDHAYLACKTALEMQKEAGEFGVRIGINTGEMIVGNMGSQMRFDYSLLGDNVNLGSRLEGTNKEYGTKILISESTQSLISGRVITRFIDTVAVKGKEQGINIYELRGFGKPDKKEAAFLQRFAKARREYQNGKFSIARDLFAKLHKDFPQDEPSKVFLRRSQMYCENPPKDWRGIYHATTK